MSIPDPRPGLVIHYSYLWSHEAATGAEEGRKDRPAALLFFIDDGDQAYVAPITHSEPTDPDAAIAIPTAVNNALGLDDDQSWIVVSELNAFTWPGADLRAIPGSDPARYAYGFLPPKFFRIVRDHALKLARERKAQSVKRTD